MEVAGCLVPRGGWRQDGGWAPVPYLDVLTAEKLFRHKVLRFLKAEGLISDERIELLLSRRHSGFSVDTSVRVEREDEQAVRCWYAGIVLDKEYTIAHIFPEISFLTRSKLREEGIRMRVWTTLLIMILAAGCGGSSEKVASPELASTSYGLARDGNVAGLRTLLAENPGLSNTPVYRGETCLLEIVVDIRPAFPRMHETIKVLLEAGADPNLDAPEILRVAIWRGDPESFEILLEHGADPLIVSPKKKMNMLEYARSSDDERFGVIADAWEKAHR